MSCDSGVGKYINPVCWVKNGAETVAQGIVHEWADAINHMVEQMLRAVGSFWLAVPSPEASHTPAVARMQADLQWYAMAAMVLGVLLCAARMALTSRGEHGMEAAKMLARVVLISGAAMAGMTFATRAGDAFSKWVLDRATGSSFQQSLSQTLTAHAMSGLTAALSIFLGIFAFLGALAMLAAAALRWVALVLLMGFWPLAASLSTTEQGQQWYRKINAWIVAFLLLKPISAMVYAAGFMLLNGGGTDVTGGAGGEVTSVIMGLVCIAAAGLTLPALLKLVAPVTAGAGGASGAAVAGGMVATGAAVATLAGGGAGAGAATAGAAGGGAASAGPSGSVGTAGGGGGGGGGSSPGSASGGSSSGPTGGGGGPSSSGGGGGGSPVPGGGESPDAGGGGSTGGATGASPSTQSDGDTPAGPSGSSSSASGPGRVHRAMGAAGATGSGGDRGGSQDEPEGEGPSGAEPREGGQR